MKKNKIIAILAILVLLSTSFYAGFVYAPTGSNYTISEGVYPGAPSYTVWADGGNYYVKDAQGGQPSVSGGTNASTLIQYALDNGKHVYIGEGVYDLDIPLTYGDDIIIEGSGYDFSDPPTNGTILQANFVNDAVIKPDDVTVRHSGLLIMKLTIYGGLVGIDLASAHESVIKDVSIDLNHTASSIGIHLRNGTAQTCLYNRIERTYIRDAQIGIQIEGYIGGSGGANENDIIAGVVDGGTPSTYGVYILGTGATNNQISTTIEGSFDIGAYLAGSAGGNKIEDSYIEVTNANSDGIRVLSNNNYLLFNWVSGQNNTYWIQSGATRTILITSYDLYHIQDDGSTTAMWNAYYASVPYVKRGHPNTATWNATQEGWIWYCTTDNVYEYWNSTHIITPAP